MSTSKSKSDKEPGIGQTVLSDLRRGDFRKTIRREWSELKEFFLTDDRKQRLMDMGWAWRIVKMSGWLLKSLFLKLNPARRLLFVVSVLLMLSPAYVTVNTGENTHGSGRLDLFAGLILIFVLMLELKDKLLAKSELQAGSAVQTALMPDKCPNVPGWDIWLYTMPAREVGGDMVDYLSLGGSRHAVALGDVSGKGLGAALLMAKLQATLRAIAPDIDSPAGLGAKLNEIFYRDIQPKSFASLIYFEIDSGSGFVRIMNAGHIPPLVVRKNDIFRLDKAAPALGLTPISKYIEQSAELAAGDFVVAFSDGLTEACNEDGEFFGDKRLNALLLKLYDQSVERVGERILQNLNYFVGEAIPHDDLSIAILRRSGD